jgi:hypothetical protein
VDYVLGYFGKRKTEATENMNPLFKPGLAKVKEKS